MRNVSLINRHINIIKYKGQNKEGKRNLNIQIMQKAQLY